MILLRGLLFLLNLLPPLLLVLFLLFVVLFFLLLVPVSSPVSLVLVTDPANPMGSLATKMKIVYFCFFPYRILQTPEI